MSSPLLPYILSCTTLPPRIIILSGPIYSPLFFSVILSYILSSSTFVSRIPSYLLSSSLSWLISLSHSSPIPHPG